MDCTVIPVSPNYGGRNESTNCRLAAEAGMNFLLIHSGLKCFSIPVGICGEDLDDPLPSNTLITCSQSFPRLSML